MLPDRIVSIGITHVPEARRLFPEMTVLENLEKGQQVTITGVMGRGTDLYKCKLVRVGETRGSAIVH